MSNYRKYLENSAVCGEWGILRLGALSVCGKQHEAEKKSKLLYAKSKNEFRNLFDFSPGKSILLLTKISLYFFVSNFISFPR